MMIVKDYDMAVLIYLMHIHIKQRMTMITTTIHIIIRIDSFIDNPHKLHSIVKGSFELDSETLSKIYIMGI